MDKQAQMTGLRRIEGVIDRGYFSVPKKHEYNGDTWESYSCHVKGMYVKTKEPVDKWFNSSYQRPIYDDRTKELYPDFHQLDGATFEGEVMVSCKGEKEYLYAVNYKKLLEEANSFNDPFKVNPFMEQSGQVQAAQPAPAPAQPQVQAQPQAQPQQQVALSEDDIPF